MSGFDYNPFSLKEKTILITGASSGIGRATAIECSRMGATAITTGRDSEKLNETYSLLAGQGHMQIVSDLTDEGNIETLLREITRLDGLVLSAGVGDTTPFAFIDKKKLDRVFDINFFAPILLAQKLLKSKKLSKGGSVVFVASIDGPIIGHVGNSIYAASKGAVSAVVKSMAVELAVKNLRVNAVLPGMTETPLIYDRGITEEQLNADRKNYPLGRYAKPEEIAHSVIYLLSEASSFTTGTGLIVDGGFTLL